MPRWARIFLSIALAVLLISPQVPSYASGASVNWSAPNANSAGTNSVSQDQLTSGTADQMPLSWSLSFPVATLTPGLNATGQGSIAPPLVVNGTVFVAMNDLEVLAVRADDGRVLWSYTPVLDRAGLPLGTLVGHVHGLVYHDGDIWLSLPDCSALALNALTGEPVQRISKICADIPGNSGNYDYSGTPVAFYGDLLVWTASSVSEGTDAGRGFVAAYNVSTGGLVWRWYVVPPTGGAPDWDAESCPAPCHGNVSPYPGDWGTLDSAGGSSRAGAGPGWGQPVIDPADRLVILGTSQPSPDWNATYRPGPNLYSDSIVALSLNDGHLVWFYQTTPHDIYDFDCGWNVALGSASVDGQNVTAVFKACKNGYVYALNAKTGAEIWHFNPPSMVRVNTENADYATTGTYNATLRWVSSVPGYEQCPGVNGGIESDISLSGGRVYVATHNFCAFITAGPVSAVGGSVSGAKGFQYSLLNANTTIYALDTSTGRTEWSYDIPGVPYRGWLTSTGGLLLASTLNGDIVALDAGTGRAVGTTHVGSPLYEGVTVGSDSAGDILVFQLTSSPSYGAFANAVPGALLAFSPSRAQSIAPWVIGAVALGVATVAVLALVLGFGQRRQARTMALNGA